MLVLELGPNPELVLVRNISYEMWFTYVVMLLCYLFFLYFLQYQIVGEVLKQLTEEKCE